MIKKDVFAINTGGKVSRDLFRAAIGTGERDVCLEWNHAGYKGDEL